MNTNHLATQKKEDKEGQKKDDTQQHTEEQPVASSYTEHLKQGGLPHEYRGK